LAAVALFAAGCLPSINDLDDGPLTQTFAVSDYFAPSGYMGDGKFFGKLTGTTNEGCKPRAGLHRGNCYSFTYFPNDIDGEDPWAGVFWVFPANSWGSNSGHAIDVSKFKQISFWAAVEGPTPYTVGGNTIPFVGQAGGINPMGRYVKPGSQDYVDGLYTQSGWEVGNPTDGVTSEMKQFHIAIKDFDKIFNCQDPANPDKARNCTPTAAAQQMGLSAEQAHAMGMEQASFIIGAFAWALHYPQDQVPACKPQNDPVTGQPIDCRQGLHTSLYINPPPVRVYLDDIVWSTEDPPSP
jgi:hypothetical protein